MVQDESAMDELPRGRAREAGADRNLLLGLLAFQRGLIAVESLVDAIHAWVLDKGRPIGSILLEWGSIDQGQLDALGRLVAEQLDETKLVPCPPSGTEDAVGSNPDLVGVAIDDQATVVLPVSEHDRLPTTARGHDRRASTPCRYRKPSRQAHARGGLGEVFIADDLELGRKVALKEIRDQNAFDEQSRARFLLEGEVTGNLEHPGIVPVYGLGTYDDGRPYYAMRFIRGKNLRETVVDLRATKDSPDDPGAKDLALRKLLRRFIDVCNAIEYAHSRDVLHRDLKPANIMLGRFGETLVVDWGLAKLIGRPTADGSTEQADPGEGSLHLSSSSGVEPTRRGALGTLQYMSPEQAAGKIDEIGPPTDVFGLGTTLYYLLTGQPPFPDGDPGKITAGLYRKPREVDREVPRALEAICVKAMATEPAGRYPSALALAEDIDRWLGDQPVEAYPDPLTTRVVRWSRRNRTKVATAASLLVAGFIALAISNVVVARERARTETARRTGVDILTLTGSALQKLMVGTVVEQLAETPGTLKARRELAEGAVAIAHEFSGRWPKDPVVALVAAPTFHMAANLDRSRGEFGRAMANYRDAAKLYDAAIDADLPGRGLLQADCIRLTIDHGEALRMSGRREEALTKYDEARRRIDRAEVGSPGDPANEKALARVCYVKGFLDLELDRPDRARPLFDQAIPLLEEIARRDKKDPDVGLILTFPLLGRAIAAGALGQTDEAAPSFARALANLEPMTPSSSVRFLRARVHDERGRWLSTDRTKLLAAEAAYDEAVQIMTEVVKDYSAFPQYRLLLANARLDRGLVRHEIGKDREDGARDDARAAREILEGLRDESPRMNELHGRLGEALGLLGRLEPDRERARGLLDAAIQEQAQAIREEPGRRRNEAARARHAEESGRIKDR